MALVSFRILVSIVVPLVVVVRIVVSIVTQHHLLLEIFGLVHVRFALIKIYENKK